MSLNVSHHKLLLKNSSETLQSRRDLVAMTTASLIALMKVNRRSSPVL